MNIRNKYTIGFITLLILLIPAVAVAQTLSSPTYKVEDSTFDEGSDSSSSPTYQSRDSVGGIETGDSSSTTYVNPSGFQPGAYPGIPGQPTFTNTGGTLYNSLDFIVTPGNGQQSDTTYAIAISSDNFVTTNYIQVDDTVGATEAWQTYSGWNSGTGERVTGLSPSTTYKIKVKASYGTGSDAEDTESGFSQEASATTSAPSLVFSINGVNSGTTIAGETTDVTSTSTTIGYGSLTVGDGNPNIAAQRLTVTTNATGGYTATVRQNNDLTSASNDTIDPVSGTNASPASFPTGFTDGRFGYHTTDSSLCTGTGNRFSSNDTYARLETTPYEVACSTGAVSSENTDIVYKLVIGTLQEAGNYENVLTYIATATY